jgi:hypothetical protein
MKKFYIGERINPQLNKSYYRAYGQLTKLEAKRKENPIYGSMIITSYNTEEEYNKELDKLRNEGFSISN